MSAVIPNPTGSEVRPPLAGKREAARRLATQVRLRLAPTERALPVLAPEVVTREEVAMSAEDAAARIDAARARLRASIQAPDEPDA